MKIRLAKKKYGKATVFCYSIGNHRITKAISLTSKISTLVDTSKKKRKYENTK